MAKETQSSGASGAATKPDDSQVAGGSAGSQASGGTSGSGEQTPQGGAASQKPPQFITPEILTGVLAAKDRSTQEALSKVQSSLEDRLEKLTKSLEESARGRTKQGSEEDPKQEAPELIELRRQNKELQDSISKVKAAHEEAQRRERDFRFKTIVTDSLVRHGCLKPEKVFRMIAPELKFSDDGQRVFTTVKSEFGQEELSVDTFIERYVAKEDVPELFRSQARQGSPAGGDASGGGSGQYDFKLSQLADPEFYKQNQVKIRAALQAKRVDLAH